MDTDKLITEAVDACERAVNFYGDKKAFAMGLCGMHRTLQQTFFSEVILGVVRRMAQNYTAQNFDARNESACKMARVMFDAVKKEYDLADDNQPLHCACI